MRKISLIVLFVLLMTELKAQYLANDSLSRVINSRVLAKISNFEACLKFNNAKKKAQFLEFFHNKEVLIANDVMPDNKLGTKVTPSVYIQLIQKYYADTSFYAVELKPYELSEITVEDEYATLSVYALKYVNSITRNNVLYIDTFNIKIDIVYLFNNQSVEINNISFVEKRQNYWQLYPQYKGWWRSKNLALDTILINGNIFPVNKYGYVQLNNVEPGKDMLFQPYKRPVFYKTYRYLSYIPIRKNKLDPKDKNITKINFWKWMAYADFRNHVIFNGESPVKLASDTNGIAIMNNGSFSNFVMLNITRRVKERGYFSFKVGAGADVFAYTSYLKSNVNTYAAVDPDGDPYLRINKITNLKERHNLTYLTVPIQLEKGFTFGKNSVYFNVAYHVMLNYSATYNQDADALYAGYYDYLFNLLIQENGVYDFGAYKFEIRNLPLSVNRLAMSYGYGLGYMRKISRKMYIDAALNYRKSIGYLFAENKLNLSDTYNALNSITNHNHQYILDFMNFSVGLSVKL